MLRVVNVDNGSQQDPPIKDYNKSFITRNFVTLNQRMETQQSNCIDNIVKA